MRDQEIRNLILFFSLAVREEHLTLSLISAACRDFRRRLGHLERDRDRASKNSGQRDGRVGEEEIKSDRISELFIKSCCVIWRRVPQKDLFPLDHHPPKYFSEVNFIPWWEFRRFASPQEVQVVLWFGVLGIPLPVIARGLGISEGSALYRLEQGLSRLSQVETRESPSEPGPGFERETRGGLGSESRVELNGVSLNDDGGAKSLPIPLPSNSEATRFPIPMVRYGERRKRSPFFQRAQILAYGLGQLPGEERAEVGDLLQENKALALELLRFQKTIEYTNRLGQIPVEPRLLDRFRLPDSYLRLALEKLRFEDWPLGLKLGLEGLITGLCLILFITIIPWQRILNLRWETPSQVILSEVRRPSGQASILNPGLEENQEVSAVGGRGPVATVASTPPSPSNLSSLSPSVPGAVPSLAVPSSPSPIMVSESNQSASVVMESRESQVLEDEDQSPGIRGSGAPSGTSGGAKELSNPSGSSSVVGIKVPSVTPAPSQVVRKGILFRGYLAVTNLDSTTPKLVHNIQDLGGRKAGEVELGWKRGRGRYFHFTIPEKRYEGLTEFLKTYGELTLKKEPHDRVMPDGILRLILIVEERKEGSSFSSKVSHSNTDGDEAIQDAEVEREARQRSGKSDEGKL